MKSEIVFRPEQAGVFLMPAMKSRVFHGRLTYRMPSGGQQDFFDRKIEKKDADPPNALPPPSFVFSQKSPGCGRGFVSFKIKKEPVSD